MRVTATTTPEQRRERFPAGSVRVSTDQPLGTLAVLLLEPSSPDSLFQWGFFNSILSPTEYVEGYIMEPMAERMLAEDPKLAEEFRTKVESDAAFRGNSRARLGGSTSARRSTTSGRGCIRSGGRSAEAALPTAGGIHRPLGAESRAAGWKPAAVPTGQSCCTMRRA